MSETEYIVPPGISTEGVPDEEHESVQHLASTLYDFVRYGQQFAYALELFDCCISRGEEAYSKWRQNREMVQERQNANRYQAWAHMTARDAMMSVYHFGRVRDGIHKTLGKCPTIRAKIDPEQLRGATKLFDSSFPTYVQVRHAISHAAEVQNTEQAIEKHAITKPGNHAGIVSSEGGARVILSEILRGRTLIYTWDGEVVESEISQASLDKLIAVREAYFSIFEPMSKRGQMMIALRNQRPQET